ncbi:uncharacterized protein At4g14100-like [Triticum dicoccoides]|uniref:Uncharacterized protein n=2 Tax=Triticum TaxID=4564 RepID=W5D759_WHEAT|nr:uncharacterized protein At4g14100-like [Triticum dicoccoides]XP_044344201.1 uncharacterized protein At4g14100-like [Triticum aestivum]CDM81562.1 unnamed protein product [Triticum aestivum]VAH72778.1 unnamed protein product [Triticum turgidum subsp. durum]
MAWPLLRQLLLIAAATTAAASASATTPDRPAPWPEQFHAVLFTNLTNVSIASTGPPLRLHDLYYDWPRRRNLNLIRHQLSGDPLYDVEWNNGTTFYFDSATCRTQQVPVGVLPPGWLADGGAVYLGRETTGGIDCHVWGKADFIVYYEDALTGRPVHWNFLDVTGLQQFVMSFEVGVVLEDDDQWQAPAHCFLDETANRTNEDDDHLDEWQAARLFRKFAGAAAAY